MPSDSRPGQGGSREGEGCSTPTLREAFSYSGGDCSGGRTRPCFLTGVSAQPLLCLHSPLQHMGAHLLLVLTGSRSGKPQDLHPKTSKDPLWPNGHVSNEEKKWQRWQKPKHNLGHLGGQSALEMSLQENYGPCAVTVGLGQCRSSIKAGASPHSHIHSLSSILLGTR